MHSQKEKHIRMYPGTKQSSTSKKRQKENRAKSKKRRLGRQEENVRGYLNLSLFQPLHAAMTARLDEPQLNLASLSKLKKNDVHRLKLLMEKKMFTTSATSIIQSTVSPTLILALDNNSDSDSGTSESLMNAMIMILIMMIDDDKYQYILAPLIVDVL
jgi:hypothetical protein